MQRNLIVSPIIKVLCFGRFMTGICCAISSLGEYLMSGVATVQMSL